MLDITKLITIFIKTKIIPVITLDNPLVVVTLGKILADHGLKVVEITLRTPQSFEAIARLRENIPELLVGAGTVLNHHQAIKAAQAGAQFLVAPGFNANTLEISQELGLIHIPGINNPTQIEQALEWNLSLVKYFPAESSGGIDYLKAILAPYPKIHVMPTGGIDLSNIHHYLQFSQIAACGGSWMVPQRLIAEQNWSAIIELVKQCQHYLKHASKLA